MRGRRNRVGEAVRDAVAAAVQEMKDPRLGLVSIVRCEMSPDLSRAEVFVSIYGEEDVVRATLKVLEGASGHVRSAVGRAVRLRHTPEIHWTFDDGMARGQRIEALLQEIRREDGD